MSSVAVHNGLVIAPTQDGYIDCVDARTGKKHWTHDAFEGIVASPLIVDDRVYVPSESKVTVLALSPRKQLLSENEMEHRVHSGAIFIHGVLYLATTDKIYAIKNDPGSK
jgi:outer membrane protein assembly factor BamB